MSLDERTEQQLIALVGRVEELERINRIPLEINDMNKTYVQEDTGIWRPALSDDGGELIVRPDHDEKIFSFAGIVEQEIINLALPAGEFDLLGAIVPADEIWRITYYNFLYVGTPPTFVLLRGLGLASGILFNHITPVVSTKWYIDNLDITLQGGDRMSAFISVCTAGDDAYLRYAGTKMKIP